MNSDLTSLFYSNIPRLEEDCPRGRELATFPTEYFTLRPSDGFRLVMA